MRLVNQCLLYFNCGQVLFIIYYLVLFNILSMCLLFRAACDLLRSRRVSVWTWDGADD